MCGITGFWSVDTREKEGVARRMADALRHRGPDDEGVWVDDAAGIALSQRRLSIVDLSPAGHQPMFSRDGRFVLVFNGEIYNHADLRAQLPADFPWRGHSDTETLVEAVAAWGVEETLSRLNGMFAFAVWDRESRTLWLARDRMGEKPLYYGFCGSTFLFGSELGALRVHPAFSAPVDWQSLALYLRYAYIPAPHSAYEGIFKLPPASFCVISQEDFQRARLPAPRTYWDLAQVAARGVAHPFPGTFTDAVEEAHRLLSDAVRIRMEADVPLGVFFSGGIDSTLVAALMQAQSPRPVRTFTIGFEDPGYDESAHARAIAAHLGTAHTELVATHAQARAVIPELARMYGEPFADSSQIPTHLLSRLTREHVTVALSGDGGDEVFGGYNRYVFAPLWWRWISRVPHALRVRSSSLALSREAALQKALSLLRCAHPSFFDHRQPEVKLHKLFVAAGARDFLDLYHRLTSMHPEPERFCDFAVDPSRDPHAARRLPAGFSPVQAMQLWDMQTYLPDDILVKVDRATMAASLESRAPYLDHRVVEFAWTLPDAWKIRGSDGKVILREILRRYVPESLWRRPKTGFGIPLEHWYGPGDLDIVRLASAGRLRADALRNFASNYLSTSFGMLWTLKVLQLWVEFYG